MDSKDGNKPIFQIRVRSPVLLKVMDEVTDQLGQRGPHEHKVTFMRPFKLLTLFSKELVEHQKKLEKLHNESAAKSEKPSTEIGPLKETESLKALEHLRLLNEFMAKNLSRTLKLREDIENGTTVRTSSAKRIQLPLYNLNGEIPAYSAAVKLREQGYSLGSFIVECFYIDFDGVQYGPVNCTFQIRKYEGERDMSALPVYPLQCDPEPDSIREAMVARGENFAVLSNPQKTAHKQYRGLTLNKHPEQVESQVIIDFQLAFLEMSDNRPQIGLDSLVDHDTRETTLAYYRCVRCSSEGCCGNDFIVPDYTTDEKEEQDFKNLHGSLIDSTGFAEDLTQDQKALLPFKNLVVDENIKETVLALVENHESVPGNFGGRGGSLPSADLIQGKGKGLIILLHGEPGVGKTSTAECVADHTKRPLFRLHVGILFLTTNRVGQIDRAFKSRIHVSLYYPKLDKKTSIQIWKNNIVRIRKEFEAQYSDVEIRDKEIIKFAKEHFKDLNAKGLLNWNGRQIRNAFQTAVALASFDAKKNKRPNDLLLGKEQFIRVALAAEQFDKYLLSLSQGKNDSQLAEEHRWRVDNFQNQPIPMPMIPKQDPGHLAYAFGQPTRSSKSRRSEREAVREAQSSESDSDSSASSDDEESGVPQVERDQSSESESSSASSEEDRKKKSKKSSSKTKDGKKKSSHKRSK
ncbi:hypothetical protein N7493_011199 [Penicillium malachiteum]|uniref:ATPase AAA-type core domain-containing protein n=1 Tax=Penicillium malachiteum TaxID=1324776 RepID=A0AAD6MQY9_9EURO|nr:hypothetical protein N7493_011199 [Penicillium malachiteum]